MVQNVCFSPISKFHVRESCLHLKRQVIVRFLTVLAAAAATLLQGATTSPHAKQSTKKTTAKSSKKHTSVRKAAPAKAAGVLAKPAASVRVRKVVRKTAAVRRGPWQVPNYAVSTKAMSPKATIWSPATRQ